MKAVTLLGKKFQKKRYSKYRTGIELIDWDIRYGYDENNRDTYNVFNVTVKSVDISRECDFDINRIDYGLTNKKDSMDDNNNFISDYYYVTVKLNVNKDINDHDVPPMEK